MNVECRFFATYRAAVGEKAVDREVADELTIGELLVALETEYDELDGLLVDGEIPPQLSIMRNGRDVAHLDGTDTVLSDGDRVSVFPPVAGGSGATVRRERSYRGISVRLARNYLTGLGGEPEGDDLVVGDGWRAALSAETVSIGPTLTLTEVTVAFEGEPDRLDGLIERFSQKAMRAGG